MDGSRELKRIVRIQKYSHLRLIKSYLNQGSEEDSDSSEESQEHPSPLRKLAWAWERRALRAEASLKRYQDGRSHGENGRSKA